MRVRHLVASLLLLVVAQYSALATNSYSFFGNDKKQTNDILASHHHADDGQARYRGVPAAPNESRLSPVILVPGDGGSRIEAKLDKKDVAHHYCERKSDDWFDLWVNLSLLVPFAIDCWVEK